MKDLQFIGIGGAYALGLGGNCAFLKEGKTLLLFDCCEDATIKLKNAGAFEGTTNIVIALTHTHADHVAGIGTLIWYCNFILNIKPQIITNSPAFKKHLSTLLSCLGVQAKFFDFIKPTQAKVGNIKIEMMPTNHTAILDCFGIMLTDQNGKYYYTGDTKDFDFVKALTQDPTVKKIYCEASWDTYDAHIKYDLLKTIKCEKLTLMHFEDEKLYALAKKDGFNVANKC